ncbi:MAG: serine/threonine-protein kinase [Myxococcales bacterium]|nr:serine/threonine protein kinase [Polyangiaceae bacterium]MDW8248265.1 serine/threonine-protein kinase [Myxococcales bacterium]
MEHASTLLIRVKNAFMMVAEKPQAESSSRLPRRFGKYTLLDTLGKGGMAEILLAREQTNLGATRLLVIKQILPELAENPAFADVLIREGKLAARLTHANVVQVTDLGRYEGKLFLAMEYVEGFDLNELLRRCSKSKIALPVEFALLIVAETLRALDYAHRRTDDEGNPLGLVHRDVSPSNVLVSFEGEVKLCDFGIAHANEAARDVAGEQIQGKAGYMSPEQAHGEPLDARADVFSAGVILWELLAGRRYYRPAEGQPMIALARSAPEQPLPERGLAHEDALRGLVARALRPRREERYPSAQAMLRELETLMVQAGLVANPLRFGSWLREHFAEETLERRRARERALRALDTGPPVVITPLPPTVAPEELPPPSSTGSAVPPPAMPLASVPSPGFPRWGLVVVGVVVVLLLGALAFR